MQRALFTITINELVVLSNGDLPGASGKKNNALLATLEYPRSGAPSVLSTRLFDLADNTPVTFEDDTFWTRGLFKEEIQGSSRLKIVITDRDETSKIQLFFTKFVAALMGAALGTATGGIGNALLGAVAKFAIKEYTGTITIGKETVQAIAESATIELDPRRPPTSPLTLPLTAPGDVIVMKSTAKGGKAHRERITLLTKGQANGHITLTITATPL